MCTEGDGTSHRVGGVVFRIAVLMEGDGDSCTPSPAGKVFVQPLLGKWLLFLMDSLKGLGWLGGNAWGGRAGTRCDASFYEQGRGLRGGSRATERIPHPVRESEPDSL